MKTKLFTTVIALLLFLLICENEDARAQVLEQDSLALVALYNSTDGANWTNNTNWLTGPVPTWYGVGVYNNRVLDVSLYSNNLNGTIPTEIGNLDGMYNINLAGNQLSGSIPTEIGNLNLLTNLYLHENDLQGTIPSSVVNMTSLERFSLSGNQLTGSIPAVLGTLVNLKRLQLDWNQLSGTIPPELGNLNNLEWLWLSYNQLTDSIPAELENLGNLKQMYLYHNQLSGSIPSEFTNLDSLVDLYINDNQFTELPDLSSLTVLTGLKIQNNKFTFEDIEPNIGISVFQYSPQDSVGEGLDTTIAPGTSLTLTVVVGGTANLYQWTKDGFDIPGATNNTYDIVSADTTDSGLYVCKITNTIATELTLYSRQMNVTVESVTATEETKNAIPKEFTLSQNFPNPFNPATTIRYTLPESGNVKLNVYNLLGEQVAELVNEFKEVGAYAINFNADNLQSGVYIYKIEANGFVQSRKLMLIK